MKKLTTFLCVLLCSIAIHAEVMTGSCGDNLVYQYDTETKALTIFGSGAMTDYDWNTQPWYDVRTEILSISLPNGLTSIGDNAFYGCSAFASIIVPDGVLDIGNCAFNWCRRLTDVSLPNTITSIGYNAFSYTPLANFSIPNSCTHIGDYAFLYCNLTSIVIPASVTEIGAGAFAAACREVTSIVVDAANPVYDSRNNCNAIIETATNTLIAGCTYTTIPNDIASIGEAAFRYTKISSLDIPQSVTSIGHGAFQECYDLTAVTIPNSVVSIGTGAFPQSLTSIIVEAGNPIYDSRENCNAIIETVSNTLIIGCQNSSIPYGVTSIGASAFSICSGLTSISIPNSVIYIGNNAFSNCSNLTEVIIPNSVQNIDQYAFDQCGFSSVIIPSSVTNISYGAFSSCSQVTMESTTPPTIGYNTFKSDATIYVPCSALETYQSAENWSALTLEAQSDDYKINLFAPENCIAEVIDFDCATNSATIEATTTIEAYQFSQWSDGNTDNPRTLTLTQDTTLTAEFVAGGQCGDNLYWSFDLGTQALTITGTGDMWDYGWYNFAPWINYTITEISLPYGLTSIGSFAFYDCRNVTSITIPSSVTRIGEWAFAYCYGPTSIVIPNGVTSIGEHAFDKVLSITYYGSATGSPWGALNVNGYVEGYLIYESEAKTQLLGCLRTATGEVVIPNSVTAVGDYAFQDCSGITMVTIPESVTSIGLCAFSWCSGLISISIPNSVTHIGSQAFGSCSNLASVTLNNGLITIGSWAFEYCTSLTSITIPSTVTYIGSNLLEGCWGLTELVVEEGNSIYDSRDNCNALIETATNKLLAGCQTTIIPEGITTIGGSAFIECRTLASITFPSTLQTIEGRAFAFCYSLGSVSIPSSVTYMGREPFYYCWGIETITMEGATPPAIESNTFDNVNAEIYIPCAVAMAAYREAPVWSSLELKGESGYNVSLPAAAEGTAKVVGADCADNSVLIQAIPDNTAYKFSQWSDGNTDNPRKVVLTQDTTLTAQFIESPVYTITIQGMSVDVYYNDGTSEYFYYLYTGVQNVTFTLPEGSLIGLVENGSCGSWLGWSDGSTVDGYIVTIESDTTIISRFDVPTYQVNISAGGGGYIWDYINYTEGNITGERNTCNNYIHVEARSYDGYYFKGWSDGYPWSGRSFYVEQDTTITALFAAQVPAQVTLSVESNSTGMGTVYGGGTYNTGEWIEISAMPNEGYHFVEWSDGYGYAARYIYLVGDTTLSATFAAGDLGGKCGENLYWVINNDSLIITGYGDMDLDNYTTWQGYGNTGYYFYASYLSLPEGITSISENAFRYFNLSEVAVPASVTYIGARAFANNYNLQHFEYQGNQLTTAYYNALSECYNLRYFKGVSNLIENNYSNVLDSVIITNGTAYAGFYGSVSYIDNSKATEYYYTSYDPSIKTVKTLFLPEWQWEIYDFELYNARYLTAITIPENVTYIGESAFEECRSLESVVFVGNNVETIGDWAFYNCHELQSIAIPEGVTSIGKAAFFNCTYLAELTIPSSMQRIADNGFGACAKLQRMYVNAVVPPVIEAKTFEDVDRSIPVFVPRGTMELYQADQYWQEFFNMEEYDAPTGILNGTIDNRTGISKVLKDGQVLIIRGEETYTILGEKLTMTME